MPDVSLKRISYQALEEILHITSATGHSPDPPPESISPAVSPAWDFASQAFGIYVENELVGVYCMTVASETDTLWLGGYLIEQRYQAHGYGQTTLLEILKKINQDHPYCLTINLAVEPEKVVAQHLCQKKSYQSALRRLSEEKMTHRIPYKIHTPRLTLRCWQPQDAALLKEAVDASLDHLRPWMPWAHNEPQPLHMKRDGLRKFRGQFDLDQQYVYGIFDPQETHALGSCGLHKRDDEGVLEIGYWIHAAFINHGYATECAAALTKVAFRFHQVSRMEIHCDANNSRSAAVPKKLGYNLDAVLRRRSLSSEQVERDVMIWTLFADEFPGSPSQEVEISAFDAAGESLAFD